MYGNASFTPKFYYIVLDMKVHFSFSKCFSTITTLLLVPFAHVTSGLAVNQPTPSIPTSNQSNTSSNDLPSTNPLGDSAYRCTDAPEWTSHAWNPADCQVALLRLALSESDRHGDTDFEFVAPGAHPTKNLPRMSTPRRYTSGELEPPVDLGDLVE